MKRKERYACVLVREFPAQAIVRLRPELRDIPLVLLKGEPPLQTVLSLNAKARLLGIRRDMTKVEVEAFAGVVCISHSSSSEAATKSILLECASAYAPRIEIRDEANSFLCCLDVTGTETLFGPTQQLAKSLRLRCASLGISAQIVVSNDFHTSILAARGLSVKLGIWVIDEGDEATALAGLPLSVLNLSREHAKTFSLWGIRNLGMLAALPQTQLIARLGQEGKKLQQLATGALPHLFQPIEIPFVLEEQVELDNPLDNLESLLFGVAIMLEQLIVRASMRIYALASITVELTMEGGRTHQRTVSPRVPTNDRHLWLKLLRLDLEAHPATAPIISVRVHAEPGSLSKVQLGLFAPQLPESGRLDVTLARIAAIVGENNVGAAVLDDTHAANGFHLEIFTVPTQDSNAVQTQRKHTCLRRIVPPSPTAMKLEGGKPSRFSFQGRRYHVEHSYGPWLVGGGWWGDGAWGQQQWDLIARGDDNTILFCCIRRDCVRDLWHLAGLYD